MPRSTDAGGATPVQDESRGPSGPEDKRNTGAALNNGGARANSPMSESAQTMEEPTGGANNGRRASTNPEAEGRHVPLAPSDWQAAEFMRSGGWTIVHSKDGARAGVGSHGVNQHTVLHPDEYVDIEALRPLVEEELGFTYEQVRSVYRQGRLSATQRELREAIDARVLALSVAGGNVALLGRVLGFHVNEAGACEALNNALARARKERS